MPDIQKIKPDFQNLGYRAIGKDIRLEALEEFLSKF